MNRTPAHTLSDVDLRRLRARSQQLAGLRARTPLDAVTRLAAVQAQDSRAAALGIRARSEGLDAKTLDTSIRNRAIVRTWAIRGTLHVLAAGDVHWITQLCGPRYVAQYRRARLALGLTDALVERVINALPAVLRSSAPVTRLALVDRLRDAGVTINPKGQASAHLVVVASLMGILCCGPDTAEGRSTNPGGGIIRPVLLVDGRVAGVWRLRDGEIAVDCFGSRRYRLEQEARDVTSFVADLAALATARGVVMSGDGSR